VTLSTDELDVLEDNVAAMRNELKAGDFEAAARLDFEFHRRILLASGNQAMLSILTASADIFLESQKLPFIRAERAMETWQEHRKILRALARRASGAAKAMHEHVRNAALRWNRFRRSRHGVTWAIPKLMGHHSKTQSSAAS
jgi:GntR family transcriptional repressor for pyruvate dehydrogenase complex